MRRDGNRCGGERKSTLWLFKIPTHVQAFRAHLLAPDKHFTQNGIIACGEGRGGVYSFAQDNSAKLKRTSAANRSLCPRFLQADPADPPARGTVAFSTMCSLLI